MLYWDSLAFREDVGLVNADHMGESNGPSQGFIV